MLVQCPHCSKQLNVPDTAAGKKAKCPGCNQVFDIAAPTAVAAAPPVPRPAPPPPPPPARGDAIEDDDRLRRRDRDDDYDDDRGRRRRRDEDDDDRPRSRRDDDYDDDRPRRRDRDDDYDDDRGRRRGSGVKSGGVTGVGVMGIVLGSLDLLLGLCMLIGVLFIGGEGGRGGAFAIPGFGGAMAIMVIVTLIILAWGAMAISAGVGILNRRNWARITMLVVGALGAVAGLIFLLGAIGSLSGPDIPGAGGARMMGFLINFLIAAILIGYCVWAYVVLLNSRNAAEFS